MKTIDLGQENLNLEAIIELAREEPLLLLTPDGEEFCLSEADDFEKEVEALRNSKAFQKLLDQRAASNGAISLDEIEQEMERETLEKKTTD